MGLKSGSRDAGLDDSEEEEAVDGDRSDEQTPLETDIEREATQTIEPDIQRIDKPG